MFVLSIRENLMFTPFSDQIAAGTRPLLISQLTLWNAINQRALEGVAALAALNMNLGRQSLTDASAALESVWADKTDEVPAWFTVCQTRDFNSFALFGQEASNICTATQNDIVKLMQQGVSEVAHDVPLMFQNAAADSSVSQVSTRKNSGRKH
jgi:hypothetical protein